LRLGRRVSKYAIWAGFGAILHLYRDQLVLVGDESAPFPRGHAAAFGASALAVFAVGARKINGGKATGVSRALDAAAIGAFAVAAHALHAAVTAEPPPPPPPPKMFFGLF
jgi:hypothetical protein